MARFPFLLAILVAAPAPLLAQDEAGEPPEREALIEVYGDDPCPVGEDGEIVVCARRPESERYRIPAPLRRSSRPPEQSWASRAEALDEASRDARPGSCSVVGSFGQSGCTQQMIRQWAAERRARRRAE